MNIFNATEENDSDKVPYTKLVRTPIFHSTVDIDPEQQIAPNVTSCRRYSITAMISSAICVSDAYDEKTNETFSKVCK